MSELLATLTFSLSVTGPIFLMLGLGIFLRRIGLLDDAFINVGSRLVFNVTLPALLFISIVRNGFEEAANLPLIQYTVAATILCYLLLEYLAGHLVQPPRDRGVVVQGAFRSNMRIIGLAYCVNAFGDRGLAASSLYLGVLTILVNILSVITLNRSLEQKRRLGPVLVGIPRNPLIIGILLALLVAWSGLQLPAVLLQTGDYFAQMTLPLALLCIGASLDMGVMRREPRNALLATGGKLLLVPTLLTLGAYLFGFRSMDLGILFLMTSTPTAAASYVFVRATGGNAPLAANIIALSTLLSLPVVSIGLMLLRHWHWI